MDLHSVEFKTPFIGIIQMSSEVAQAVMERCVTKNQVNELNSCEKIYTVRVKLSLSDHVQYFEQLSEYYFPT